MKDFHLERKMMSLLGDFHPTGHLFVMVPTADHARRCESLLARAGYDCGTVFLLTPDDVLGVMHLFDRRDIALPSVGFEEHTVRHFGELASEGHHALLIPVRTGRACERVIEALQDAGMSSAVHYRHFVIEELVS
jgi:hypothetical protein